MRGGGSGDEGRLLHPRELIIAVMIVLLFFCIGGAWGCMANLSERMGRQEGEGGTAGTSSTSLDYGMDIRTIHMDNGDICYVLMEVGGGRERQTNSMDCMGFHGD